MNPRKPFIVFDEMFTGLSKRTKTWLVRNHLTHVVVGVVKWQTSFRKYGFYPAQNMVFDANCLDHISSFLKQAMHEHLQKHFTKSRVKLC
jgi:hypothetical protein